MPYSLDHTDVLQVTNINYNIASRATQSNSVYVSVLQISTVHADGVSKLPCHYFFFALAAIVEFLNEPQKEKNNGKGNSASAFQLPDIQKCPAFSERQVHEFYGLKARQISKVRASSHEYPYVEKIKNIHEQNFKGQLNNKRLDEDTQRNDFSS